VTESEHAILGIDPSSEQYQQSATRRCAGGPDIRSQGAGKVTVTRGCSERIWGGAARGKGYDSCPYCLHRPTVAPTCARAYVGDGVWAAEDSSLPISRRGVGAREPRGWADNLTTRALRVVRLRSELAPPSVRRLQVLQHSLRGRVPSGRRHPRHLGNIIDTRALELVDAPEGRP
jgi:hypothetical protein